MAVNVLKRNISLPALFVHILYTYTKLGGFKLCSPFLAPPTRKAGSGRLFTLYLPYVAPDCTYLSIRKKYCIHCQQWFPSAMKREQVG